MPKTSRDNRIADLAARMRTASRYVADHLRDAFYIALHRAVSNYMADVLARAVDKEIITSEQRQQIIALELEAEDDQVTEPGS